MCGEIDNEEVIYSNYSFSTIKYIGMTQGSDTIDFIFSSTVSLINSNEHTFVLSNGELSNVGFDITETDYVNFIQAQKFSTETDNSVVPPKPKNGLILYWYDVENEKKWSTSYGSADQSNSEILVIDLERDKQNPDYFKVLFQLNCKLYNPTGTKVLDVNNLRYLGRLPYK